MIPRPASFVIPSVVIGDHHHHQQQDDSSSASCAIEALILEQQLQEQSNIKKRAHTCCDSDDDDCSPRRRRVRFNPEANQFRDNDLFCKEDCKATWHTRDEQAAFKSGNTNAAKAMIRQEVDYQLNDDNEETLFRPVLERALQACCQRSRDDQYNVAEQGDERVLPPADEALLASFYADDDNTDDDVMTSTTRLGLERLAVRKLRRDKSARRGELVQTVLELQEEYAATSLDVRAEIVAQEARQISRPSRLLAAHLGRAVELAVNNQGECAEN